MTTNFNFDEIIDRRTTPNEKWDRYKGRDVLPLWVADMDFATASPILDAMRARIEHRVFGYADVWPGLLDAIVEGIARDHDWRIDPDWLVALPGVVTGFNLACRISGAPGDEAFTATPIYPPFLGAPANNDRHLLKCPLVRDDDGRWVWDRDAVEATISPRTRLFMLCNPHNPVGRVFNVEELTWIAELAERHDLLICSDDIHCGLVLDPQRPYHPIAALNEHVAQRTITLMAPSKTWNIPSLYFAFAIIPDPTLRSRYRHATRGLIPHPNVLGMVAAEAAYRDGGPWRLELLDYLRGNRNRVHEAVNAMPGLSTSPVEATYLTWIDCREAGIEHPAAFFEQAGVGLSDGGAFGMPGFVRLNFGCPRATLDQALARMHEAVGKHQR